MTSPIPSFKVCVCLLCVVFLLVACGDDKTATPNTETNLTPTAYPTEYLGLGATNYSIFCVACHAPDARGIDNLGFDLVESAFVRTQTDQQLLDFIAQGRPASQTLTGVEMPARGGYPNLTDGQILTAIAYLRSLGAVYDPTHPTPTPKPLP